jgi:stage II sporulation protein D
MEGKLARCLTTVSSLGRRAGGGWSVAVLAVLLVAVVTVSGCRPKATTAQPAATEALVSQARPAVVRVLLLSDQTAVTISAAQPPTFTVGNSTTERRLRLQGATRISYGAGGWNVGGSVVGSGALTIIPAPGTALGVNNSSYRGNIRLVADNATSSFDVINDVLMDDYLMSVVSRELYPNFQPQAYEAQAIVARTYAMYEVGTTPAGQVWDVYDDTRSQVYGGLSSETSKSREAVQTTRGVVVAFGPRGKERVFKAYFSACCGGVGQSAADAFADQPIPPLVEKNVGTLCSISNRYTWAPVTLTKAEVTRRLKLWGQRRGRAEANMQTVAKIEIAATNRFGRPSRFLVIDARGTRYSLIAEELRWAMNTGTTGTTLFSSFVTPVDTGAGIRFEGGRGHGHGVGMCQWCAEAQAQRGMRHEQIVLHAFPGARLIRAY